MSETRNQRVWNSARMADTGALRGVIDSALEHGSDNSITLGDSTIGVNLDSKGDWTISVGLSLSSDRFHLSSSRLEGLGFFHATENEGVAFFLWTSILAQNDNVRTATEQVLVQAVRILQAAPVSQYIK